MPLYGFFVSTTDVVQSKKLGFLYVIFLPKANMLSNGGRLLRFLLPTFFASPSPNQCHLIGCFAMLF